MIDFTSEISYTTARSGGKGGQNVNKVETMAEARWVVTRSRFFSDGEKDRILRKLDTHINKEGVLLVRCSETRSQLENKAIAGNKMLQMVTKALLVPKKRKPSRIPKAVIQKRLDQKRQQSEKKQSRRKDY